LHNMTNNQPAPVPWAEQQSKGRTPCLTVLTGGPVGMLHTLDAEAGILIGRGSRADLQVTSRSASRRHAQIRIDPLGGVVVEDLGSTNGTYLNGKLIKRYRLQDGDRLQLGPRTILKFSYQDEIERDFYQDLVDREIKDTFTGIYSKRYVFNQIVSTCAHAERYKTRLSLLIFAIDGFWLINEIYDRAATNFVVKTLARIVRRELRADDVFARYGGDRFMVLARDLSDKGTVTLARRIRRAIKARRIIFDGMRLPVSISLGIGTMSAQTKDPAVLIKQAEDYLRMARYAGKGCIAGAGVRRFGS
jgi:two-component system cell cycle response regulator